MNKKEVEALRQKYNKPTISIQDMNSDPFSQFHQWFQDAVDAECLEPNAMTLSTVALNDKPAARTVLFKGKSDRSGLTFYTNYTSRKGQEISGNPFGSLLFCWLPLIRQIRIEGRVVKLSSEESETYFESRPRGSQIGAWASPQSQVIESRETLVNQMQHFTNKFEHVEKIPVPPHWGGYELIPDSFEFWQGNDNRLHDRFYYEKVDEENWTIERLAP